MLGSANISDRSVAAARDGELASCLDKPHDPATWAAIQAAAKANMAAYASAFAWVPRNGASIWPVWPKKVLPPRAQKEQSQEERQVAYRKAQEMGEPYGAQMPFSKEFWKGAAAASAPAGIRGFICELPMEWTEGQNNHPAMNMILLTQFDAPAHEPGGTALAAAETSTKEKPA